MPWVKAAKGGMQAPHPRLPPGTWSPTIMGRARLATDHKAPVQRLKIGFALLGDA
jgi:hypothetical protein